MLSDKALEAVITDPASFARLSIYKGWAFVLVTALLLAILLRGELRKQDRAHSELEHRVAERTRELNALDAILVENFPSIAHCSYLYCMGLDGIQISNNIGQQGIVPGHAGRDRSQRPYMKEAVPAWGFLLSDAYIGLTDSGLRSRRSRS